MYFENCRGGGGGGGGGGGITKYGYSIKIYKKVHKQVQEKIGIFHMSRDCSNKKH